MKLKEFVPSLLLTGTMLTLLITPALSQQKLSIGVESKTASTKKSTRSTQQATLVSNSRFMKPITEIRRLTDMERPSRSAQMLLVQSPAPQKPPTLEVVQVIGVKANPTNRGVEVILQTNKGQQLRITNRSVGNNFMADIPNAQLRLKSGNAFTFRSTAPIAGVSEITVTNYNATTIRVTVTGEAKLPTVELFDSPNEGLIFSVASTAPSLSQQKPQTQSTPVQPQRQNQTQPTQPSAQGDEPIELVVTGEASTYRDPNVTTATKTETPVHDIPQSIQEIPRQVIEDRVITNSDDAVRTVSGVIPSNPSYQASLDTFSIRGFDGNQLVLRNGLRELGGNVSRNDLTNLERIEILKGPASVLYGQGGLAGAVNIITKQPLRDPFYNLEFLAGSYDLYRPSVDLSGPLNDSRTLLYRLNAFYQKSNTFIDFSRNDRWLINPVFSWQIGPKTKLSIEGDVSRTETQSSPGLPAVGTVLPNPNGKIPINRFAGEPGDYGTYGYGRIGYTFEHQFSDNLQIRNAFRYTWSERGIGGGYVAGSSLDADGRTLRRFYFDGLAPYRTNGFVVDTDLIGKFQTGSIKHQVVFGVEFFQSDSKRGGDIIGEIAPLDLFNPVYGSPREAITATLRDTQFQNFVGVYLQDQIALADNLKVLLGGRLDWATQDTNDLIAQVKTNQLDQAFSPRVGIVYQPIQPISLYASYSKSFNLNSGTDVNNNPFQPERGTQYEVGIKADLSKQLSATLALFDLSRSNVLTTDPTNTNFSIQTGRQRSRGIELDISGEILPGWNISAGYAYIDAHITEDNTFAVGNRLNNAPQNSLGLFSSYKFQSGGLKGLGFGVGLFYVGERFGDLDNSFKLPSYFRTDVSLFYKRDRLRAAVSIKNFFDINYYEAANGNLSVYPGEPRTVQGTISWQF
ncbi:MAG: TonB-dependent siderophore receptor [Rhizonema sp. PD37]|nr:TonB-dependent siderophore receptor [Rhizonema sp. PD37]